MAAYSMKFFFGQTSEEGAEKFRAEQRERIKRETENRKKSKFELTAYVETMLPLDPLGVAFYCPTWPIGKETRMKAYPLVEGFWWPAAILVGAANELKLPIVRYGKNWESIDNRGLVFPWHLAPDVLEAFQYADRAFRDYRKTRSLWKKFFYDGIYPHEEACLACRKMVKGILTRHIL